LKLIYSSLNKKNKRLLVGGIVLAVLLLAGIVEQQFFEKNEVIIGERAETRIASFPWHDSLHKVMLVHDPTQAFIVRRELIRKAKSSIDMCTFLWRDDDTGIALMQELITAAQRGVRVRLLGDGIFFLRKPPKIAALAQAHPWLQLRLYNPLDNMVASLGPSGLDDLILDFSDINQRLHMKILTIDGEQSLVGGRNVGNEYFGLGKKRNFIDRDILLKGPAVGDINTAFDLFWDNFRTKKAQQLKDAAASTPDAEWLQQSIQLTFPEKKENSEAWKEVENVSVWYDRPGLVGDEDDYNPRLLADRLTALVGAAMDSVLIETPYLILSERTRALFKELRKQKPKMPIRFHTNSLASTDNWQTYAAFQAQLRSLLEELQLLIYLKKPDSLKDRSGPTGTSTVHSKTVIVDNRKTAIGSFNWDPRSGIWNAEIMVVIDDTSFADALTQYIEPLSSPSASWVVAKLQQPIALAQIDAIGSTINSTISEVVGVNIWPLTNAACFEQTGEKVVSPYDPDFYKNYQSVGSYPEVSIADQKRILVNLLEPIGSSLAPTL